MDKVTIILTCYKQEKYLEDTILSVINQLYTNWELLIGDDSPDDNCWNIISKYTKKYPDKIFAWHHSPNKGIVNNMLFLIEQRDKKSQYIAFLEGDDCMFSRYLEAKMHIFQRKPNVQLIYNEVTTINSMGNVINERHLKKYSKGFLMEGKIDYKKLMSEVIYVSWSTIMVRSKMIEKYGIIPPFSGDKTLISDMYFFNQIAHNENVFGIDNPLIFYRVHDDSTSRNILGSIKFHLDLLGYMNYLFGNGLIDEKFYNHQTCRWYLIIGLLSVKKSFNFGFFKTLKIFFFECVYAINRRFEKMS